MKVILAMCASHGLAIQMALSKSLQHTSFNVIKVHDGNNDIHISNEIHIKKNDRDDIDIKQNQAKQSDKQVDNAFAQKFDEQMKDVVVLLKKKKVEPENTVLYLRATAGARSEKTGKPLPEHLANMKIINDQLLAHTFGTLAQIPDDAAEILEDKKEGSLALETMKNIFRRNFDKDELAKWAMHQEGCGSPGCRLVSMEQGGKSAQICDNDQCEHDQIFSSMIANMGMNALWKNYENTCGLKPENGSFDPTKCKEAIETDLMKHFPPIKNHGRYVLFGGWFNALEKIKMTDKPMKFEVFLDTMNEKFKELQQKKGKCVKDKPVKNEWEGKDCLDIVLLQVMLQKMINNTDKPEDLKYAEIVATTNEEFGWTAALMRQKQKQKQMNIVLIDAGSSSSKVWYMKSGGEPKKLKYKPTNMEQGLF